MLQERKPSLFILGNEKYGVVGIEINDPGTLGEAFWKDILQYQRDNSDGNRTLSLVTKPDHSNKKPLVREFTDQEIKQPDNERCIIDAIRSATKVYIAKS